MTEENLEELAFLESEEQRVILKELLDLKYGQDYILECRIKSMEKIKLTKNYIEKDMGIFLYLMFRILLALEYLLILKKM